MFIEKKIEYAMQRLLQQPGAEGLTASDVIARAIDLANCNNAAQLFGISLSTEGYTAMEAVLELAEIAARTEEDWLAIHHVAEIVGIEDALDDISIASVV